MRSAVLGTGGVGGYFGGLLAKAGEDVTFVARGQHLRAIQDFGLRVESVHGDFTVLPAKATNDPAAIGAVDLVICATKAYHIEDAAIAMRPLIGPGTTVLPLQNGVDAAQRIAAIIGPEPVLGGLCYVGSMIAAPGVIRQQSPFRRIVAGEFDGAFSARLESVVAVLTASGAAAEATPDIRKALWTKFAFIAPLRV